MFRLTELWSIMFKMVAAMVVVVFVGLDYCYAGGARAWTRQAPWYMPRASCMCHVLEDCNICACIAWIVRPKPFDMHMLHTYAAKGQ